MTNDVFTDLIAELDVATDDTLFHKGANYAPGADRLHNFHAGADVMGGTPAQACWGYMTKHLVSLRDKVMRNDFHDLDALRENCMDISNYIRFLWCLGNEEAGKYATEVNANDRADT